MREPWTGDRAVQVISVVCSDMCPEPPFCCPLTSESVGSTPKDLSYPCSALCPVSRSQGRSYRNLRKHKKPDNTWGDGSGAQSICVLPSLFFQEICAPLTDDSLKSALENCSDPSICHSQDSRSQDRCYRSPRRDKKRHKPWTDDRGVQVICVVCSDMCAQPTLHCHLIHESFQGTLKDLSYPCSSRCPDSGSPEGSYRSSKNNSKADKRWTDGSVVQLMTVVGSNICPPPPILVNQSHPI